MIQSICFIAVAVIAVTAMTWYYRRQQRELMREKSILLIQQEAIQDQQKQLQETIRLSARYREEIAEMMRESGLWERSSSGDAACGRPQPDSEEEPKASAESVYDEDVVPDCHNIVIRSVLQHKAWECRQKGIPMTLDLQGIDSIRADDMEVVGIFFNLLDNAIEACLRIPDPSGRWIRMESHKEKKNWHLQVENSCPEESRTGGDRRTWKPDPENHGIGLTILRDLVRENRGRITAGQSGGIYRTDIYMPLRKD